MPIQEHFNAPEGYQRRACLSGTCIKCNSYCGYLTSYQFDTGLLELREKDCGALGARGHELYVRLVL